MSGSEPDALPLGDSPIDVIISLLYEFENRELLLFISFFLLKKSHKIKNKRHN